ncbi:unnamed protein product, partial [Nesidiocoris tenuis]
MKMHHAIPTTRPVSGVIASEVYYIYYYQLTIYLSEILLVISASPVAVPLDPIHFQRLRHQVFPSLSTSSITKSNRFVRKQETVSALGFPDEFNTLEIRRGSDFSAPDPAGSSQSRCVTRNGKAREFLNPKKVTTSLAKESL